MAFAPLIIGLAGAGVSAYGQIRAGQEQKAAGEAQQAAAESQAQLDEANAQVADEQAQDTLARGTLQENQFRTQVKGVIGSQRANFAADNVDVSFGSAVDVQADAAKLGELDAQTIKNNAARAAWGYQVQSYDLRRQADITRKEGVNAAAAGAAAASSADISAAGSFLSTGTSLLAAKYGWGKGSA